MPEPAAFVAVSMPAALPIRAPSGGDTVAVMNVQACLPNGVAVDLCGVQLRHDGQVVEALGRLQCSASTKN